MNKIKEFQYDHQCSDGHEEVGFDTHPCPVCAAIEKGEEALDLQLLINDKLESRNIELQDKIDAMLERRV